jgi:hypothetical protein
MMPARRDYRAVGICTSRLSIKCKQTRLMQRAVMEGEVIRLLHSILELLNNSKRD